MCFGKDLTCFPMVETDWLHGRFKGTLASARQGHWRRDVERLAKMARFSERQGAVRAVCQSCCEGERWAWGCLVGAWYR